MIRTLTALFLSFALVIMSYGTASARGASSAVDSMVICIGTGSVVVYVDADGQPTAAPHLCPDCALHLLVGVLPPASLPETITSSGYRNRLVTDLTVTSRSGPSYCARGPPDAI